jgi:hypothetical protein
MNNRPIDIDSLTQELQNLHLRIEQIERAIAAQTATQGRSESATDERREINGIAVGDRVRVKNKVKKPATWISDTPWSANKERIATVTRVTPSQIHYVTDNGTRTWRAPNNLEKVF